MKSSKHRWALWAVGLLVGGVCLAQEPEVPRELTMEQAVTIGLAQNPELAAMQQDVRMAEANLRLADAARRLQASINGYAAAGTTDNMVRAPEESMPEDMQMMPAGRTFDLGATATVPLYTGGRLSANARNRRGLVRATQADVEATRLEVAYMIREAYRMALYRQKLIEARQKDVEAREELVRVDGLKLEVGKIPLYYYLRDKTSLANAQQELVNAERDYEVALYALEVAMGLTPPHVITLQDQLAYAPVEVDQKAALEAAAANRPELAAVRARVEAAAAEIASARSAYKPQIAAALMLDLLDNSRGEGMSGYTAAVVASLPLVDSGRRKAEVAMARARREQLAQQERQATQRVAREVLVAIANLKAADRNIRTAMEAQASAEEDYRVARLRYDAGKAINLEPLDALAALVQARVNYANAIYEFNNAVDALNRAQGIAVKAEG